ncbi:hypothetical protein O181_112371 [Austropuccinia psidii MF-1]|uniref:Uncharacterized protein n=1 Tax=Austropuccinia psidii MF-1 TaxID=1389203 RepID=A0A9Q3K2B3_9BASI|nr:hypothetical protein [Austropuccinia psidii MF-1]
MWSYLKGSQISTVMDSKLSLENKVQICAEDILQVMQNFQKRNHVSSMSPPPSILAVCSSNNQHGQRISSVHFPPQKPATPAWKITLSQQSESWAKYHLSL